MGSAIKSAFAQGVFVAEDTGYGEGPDMTEPIIIQRCVVHGTHVALHGGMVLIDAWEMVGRERRRSGAGAMTVETARALAEQILMKLPPKR